MHLIKKYANRKMYDVTTKQYVTMDDIAELVRSGEDIRIVDNAGGEEITQEVVSQLVGRELNGQARKLPLSVLLQLLQKGGGGIVNYTRRYLSFWQNALDFAEDELDKVDTIIGGDKVAAGSRKQPGSDEYLEGDEREYLAMLELLDERIDQRLGDRWRDKQGGIQEQIANLSSDVVKLTARIETFENIFSQVLKTAETASSAPKEKKLRAEVLKKAKK